MNRGELTAEIEHILGERTDLETRIHTWLNVAQKRVARLYPFDDLRVVKEDIATVSGTKSYSITTDFGVTDLHTIATFRLINGANSWKVDFVAAARLDSEEAYPESYSLGKPRRYTRWGDTVEFVDYIPDAVYSIYMRYIKWPAEMTDDTHSPDITGFDDLLIAATCAWGYATLQENEDSDYWANIAKGLWGEALRDLQEMPDYTPKMRGFSTKAGMVQEYWNNPFIRGVE